MNFVDFLAETKLGLSVDMAPYYVGMPLNLDEKSEIEKITWYAKVFPLNHYCEIRVDKGLTRSHIYAHGDSMNGAILALVDKIKKHEYIGVCTMYYKEKKNDLDYFVAVPKDLEYK